MKKNQIAEILKKAAPMIGARVHMEPEWGIAGQITYENGKKRYLRWSSLDINTLGASEIAKDKAYADYFLGKMGYSVIEGKTFFSSEFAKAIGSRRNADKAFGYAEKIGFPVIVKPNSLSQGRAVSKAHNKTELSRSLKAALKCDRVVLVQKFVQGNDYRVVVLDDEVISAYQRIPLNVIGDGKSSILRLLKKKQEEFKRKGRDTVLKLDDPRIKTRLKRLKLDMHSVLAAGEKVYLLDNANLSSGGDSVDVTDIVHPGFAKLAVSITKDMGLRLCGVDLMLPKHKSISDAPAGHGSDKEDPDYWIIEINSAPGLDHYGSIGKKQEKLVEGLYAKVLEAMGK